MRNLRKNAARLAAVLCCLLAWQVTRLPAPATGGAADGGIAFARHALNRPDAAGDRQVRPVAQAYDHIKGWVSSVGAAAALFSLDGKGPARDVCLVDPRDDTVTISPATDARYRPITLEPPESAAYEAPMGCVPADLTEDGREDVLVYYWGRSPVIFERRPGAGVSFRARDLVSPPEIWNTNAATVGDFDSDGRNDLVFGNYFPDGARVLDPASRQPSIVMPDSLSNAFNGGTNRMFLSGGGGRFRERAGVFEPTKAKGWTLALGTQDVNGDHHADLYVANDFAPDQLLINDGRGGFREKTGTRGPLDPKSKVLGRDSFKGMGVAFTDLNRDDRPDIVVSNITEPYALHESNLAFVTDKAGGYQDRSEELGLSRSGWSWDVKAADFNADGADEVMYATGFVKGEVDRWAQLQETAMSNDLILADPALWPHVDSGDDLSGRDPNRLFTRSPGAERFTDVAKDAGVASTDVTRGFAVGDADDDGRLDFVASGQWAPSRLYRNVSAHKPYLGIRPRTPTSCNGSGKTTRPAIGAAVTVTRADGSRRTQQLYPANGHGGVSAPELYFGGVGETTKAPIKASVTWRDACGALRTTDLTLKPGWHEVTLK